MAEIIQRLYKPVKDVGIEDSVANSTTLDMRVFADGILHIPAGWTTCNLTYYSFNDVAAAWRPLYDSANVAVTQTGIAASTAVQMPSACFAVALLRIVSSVDNKPNHKAYVTLKA